MASKISGDELKEVVKNEDAKTGETNDDSADDKFQEVVEEHMQKTRKQFEMVKSKSDQAYKLLKQDFEFVESKRKNFTEMSKKLKDIHFNEIVKLNVGGERFETSLETLKKFPNSLFAKMFSGSTKLKQGSDGSYFIDRDGNQFRPILNFLRREQVTPGMREIAPELVVEAKFFGLESLVKLLSIPKEEEEEEEMVEDELKVDSEDEGDEAQIENDKDLMTIEEHGRQSREALDEAESCLKDGHTSLQEDLRFLDEKRENFQEMAKRLKNVHFSEIVELRIGNHKFTTSIATLQSDPDSMLAAMFSKRFEPKQKDGAYFIDRDGTHFRHILNYLRMGEIPIDVIEAIGNELLKEAEFYNLKGLIESIVNNKSIKINLGGQIYAANIETLRKDPESLFAKMLKGDGGKVSRVDGAYFFQEEVKHMKELLFFLEEGSLERELTNHPFGLISDAKFFNLQNLMQFIDDQDPLKRSSIIGSQIEYRHQVHRWLQEKEMMKYPSLLYSAEDDGWTAAKFHELCDGKGSTLVLIESEHGCIFGGSTNNSWAGNGWYIDAKSFLFSLKSNEWDTPVIMPSVANVGINATVSYGPTFGYYHLQHTGYNSHTTIYTTLHVADTPNTNQCSFTYHGHFQHPTSVPTTNTFLAGAPNFLVKKLEVYAV